MKAVTLGTSLATRGSVSKTKATVSFKGRSSFFGVAQPLAACSSRRTPMAAKAGSVTAKASTETKPEIAKVCVVPSDNLPVVL